MSDIHVQWEDLLNAAVCNPIQTINSFGSATQSILAMPKDSDLETEGKKGWEEEKSFTASDVLALILWIENPLFRATTEQGRIEIKHELIDYLLTNLESLWKRHNGRARGWVRKHLEEELNKICSQSTSTLPLWEFSRRSALFIDFVAVVKDVRISLWNSKEDTYMLIPHNNGKGDILQMNMDTFHPLINRKTGELKISNKEWLEQVMGGKKWTLPACVSSRGNPTVAEIRELIKLIDSDSSAREEQKESRAELWKRLHWLELQNELEMEREVE